LSLHCTIKICSFSQSLQLNKILKCKNYRAVNNTSHLISVKFCLDYIDQVEKLQYYNDKVSYLREGKAGNKNGK